MKKPSLPKNILIFGHEYQLQIQFNPEHPVGVKIQRPHLIVNPTTNQPQLVQNELRRFLRSTAQRYLVTRTHQLAQKMGVKFNRLTLRQQKTRWGSCSSKHNLNFNWRLVHFPPQVIDYVIIHELSHLKEMNHSAAFWQLVKTHDPEYPRHKGFLKRHDVMLE